MQHFTPFAPSYDAIIVGARCAGAATALLLARRGARVLLIDWDDQGSDTLSTHALMRGAVMQLSRWDLLQQVTDAATPKIHTTSFYYDRDPIRVDIKPSIHAPYLIAPRRFVLDTVLANAARDAGADVRFNTAFRDVIQDSTGRVRGAILRDGSGREYTVHANLVIGADGRRSTVARRVGAKVEQQSRFATSALYAYFDGMPNEGSRWYYGPGLSAGVIPTNADQTCVFVSMPRERFLTDIRRSAQDQALRAVCAELDIDLGRQVAHSNLASKPVGFVGQNGHFRRSWGDGWCLVGDAGYFKDPATAHGITDALRDAEILANAVTQGTANALQGYQRTRDRLSADVFRITDEIASFDWSLTELQTKHLALSKAMNAEQKWMEDSFENSVLAA